MSAQLFDLTGKTALITGSSRGLGLAIAEGLAGAGARIAINGRDGAAVEKTAEALAGRGIKALTAVFDVVDDAAARNAVTKLESEVGAIDILVNNAGSNIRGPLHEYDAENFRRMLDLHITAAFVLAQAVVPGMRRRGGGKIVNIASITAMLVRSGIAAYASAKAGLRTLTQSMGAEWAPFNIQANAIAPGYFATELNTPLMNDPQFDAFVKGRVPAGRWAEPKELAGVAVFLASRAADFVTGQTLYVDGGLTARM
ncbi:MAG: glucose 1-dehydrogenase [Alphaproteobacteria bacterium]|nr:glucose 1-dehydrogenase [Alphaproteobacteria bacterium]